MADIISFPSPRCGPRLRLRLVREPAGYAVVLASETFDCIQTLACGLGKSEAEDIASVEAERRGIEVCGG